MSAESPFTPDWRIPPGETLREAMHEQRMTIEDVARRSGLRPIRLHAILNQREGDKVPPLNEREASGLAKATNTNPDFWLALDRNFHAPR